MRYTLLLSAGSALVASVMSAVPVQAQSASFAGSVTVVNPSTFTSTVSAERVVARGREFVDGTNFVVTPTYTFGNNVGVGDLSARVNSLSLGVLDTQSPTPTASFTSAAANALSAVVNGTAGVVGRTEAIAAIIRAGAGVDGLD